MNAMNYNNLYENITHTHDEFPYVTYICSIPLDFKEVFEHWHEDMEIIYIKKGKGLITLDLSELVVSAGDIIVVLPGQLHGIFQYKQETMEYENIIFSMDLFKSPMANALENEIVNQILSEQCIIAHHIHQGLEFHNALCSCLNRADHICETFPKGYSLAVKANLCQFLFLLYQNSTDGNMLKDRKHVERIKNILNYLENHYMHPISIDEISSYCGFSASHFMRFFKNEMGVSFVTYLNNYRLMKATKLLQGSQYSILEISVLCGFDNLSYFNRVFKAKYLQTPSSYRRSSHE